MLGKSTSDSKFSPIKAANFKKPVLYNLNTDRVGGRGASLPAQEIQERKNKAMFEMAKIERVLKTYNNKFVQCMKELDDFKLLVPKTKVNGEYYNDKANHQAKHFFDSEADFRRTLNQLNTKQKQLTNARDAVKVNVNNAYLHPQKFLFEQIDQILKNNELCHKECLKFEKKYNRFFLDFAKKYTELKKAVADKNAPSFMVQLKMKLNSSRNHSQAMTHDAFEKRVSEGEISQQVALSARSKRFLTKHEVQRNLVNKELKSLRVMKTLGKKSLDTGKVMTGRHAAFLITRAAKRYLMRKHVKDNLLGRLKQPKVPLLKLGANDGTPTDIAAG